MDELYAVGWRMPGRPRRVGGGRLPVDHRGGGPPVDTVGSAAADRTSETGWWPKVLEAAADAGEVGTSPAAVERQQLAEGIVVGDVGRPAVGGRDSGIERRVRVGEPLRPVVVEVGQFRPRASTMAKIPWAGQWRRVAEHRRAKTTARTRARPADGGAGHGRSEQVGGIDARPRLDPVQPPVRREPRVEGGDFRAYIGDLRREPRVQARDFGAHFRDLGAHLGEAGLELVGRNVLALIDGLADGPRDDYGLGAGDPAGGQLLGDG